MFLLLMRIFRNSHDRILHITFFCCILISWQVKYRFSLIVTKVTVQRQKDLTELSCNYHMVIDRHHVPFPLGNENYCRLNLIHFF